MKESRQLVLFVLFLFFGWTQNQLQAQSKNDRVLLEIAGKPITINEFEAIYHKNNDLTSIDKKTLDEYLELFINFKLKVQAAEDLGYDTLKKFTNELNGYKKQLSKPYMVDKDAVEKLAKEGYDRLQYDIKASHILIRVDESASPEDTLKAYNKILDIKKKLDKGADFEKLAVEYSEDPSVKDNKGNLGYFTAFRMVYTFETEAYNTPIGKISKPVRSPFGYHLIKVSDKRKAIGEVKAAHIMVSVTNKSSREESLSAKRKIDEIYTKLKAGEDFAQLAQNFSDDQGSARKGGELSWFGVGRMVPEFEAAAFALQEPGDISQPIQTAYGWHIVKLLDKKPIGTYEELKDELINKVEKDGRNALTKVALIHRIEKQYSIIKDMNAANALAKSIDSSYYIGNWNYTNASANSAVLVLQVKDEKSGLTVSKTQTDFAKFIENNQRKHIVKPGQGSNQMVINKQFEAFYNETLLNFEESNLPNKFPEYKAIVQEYRDGILLFEIMDKKVWNKSATDTAGLEAFYEQNKNLFMWPKRIDAIFYICNSDSILALVQKKYKKHVKGKITTEELLNELNASSKLNLSIKSDKFDSTDEIANQVEWSKGVKAPVDYNNQKVLVYVKEVLPEMPKKLYESRGLVMSKYQEQLEKTWIEELRNTYTVKVDQEALKLVK